LFEVDFAIMMLQKIYHKVEFVEFVIQILKKTQVAERSGGASLAVALLSNQLIREATTTPFLSNFHAIIFF
jgi:hypothetical protein